MTVLLRIAERVLNRPLLIHPDKVPLVLGVLEGRLPIGGVDDMREAAEARIAELPEDAQAALLGPSASRFVGNTVDEDPSTGVRRALPYRRTSEGVAIITITGSLINRGAWVGSYSGETSYEGIKHQVTTAAADPRAHAILLDIESPGGEAIGAFEAAAAIRAAAALKPVTAVVNGMAASAAYALASGATRIVASETALTGSVGVVLLHADFSRALDKKGIAPTFIFAGAHKVDGNPFEPLPEAVRDDLQREVNQYYELFVQTVAAGRRQMSPQSIRATEARTFIGAEAVSVGLADSVGTFEEALADVSRGSTSRTHSMKGTTMDKNTAAPAAETAGIDKTAHDAAVSQAKDDGRTEGMSTGAQAERERITGIQEKARLAPGHDALVAEMIADGKTTPDQAAGRLLEASAAIRGQKVQGLADADKAVAAIAAAPRGDNPAADAAQPQVEQNEDGWKAEFAASKALQAEFATASDYVAFKRAEATGKVRILGGKRA